MPFRNLTEEETLIVVACMRAAVSGPFFPLWEFHTLFGLEHQQAADIAWSAHQADDSLQEVECAISNSLNHLTGYPHRRYDVWDRYIPVSPQEVRRILAKWHGRRTIDYVEAFR